ncbi:MAG: hypothetical protein CMJ47_03790 [Planctomyces sp.]|nr:hypothetical protein [Planctomyces sp.]
MQLKWCLTLLATVLLAGSSANASIVIDDFLTTDPGVSGTGTTADLTRDTFALTSGGGFATIVGGTGTFTGGPNSSFTATYDIGGGFPNPNGFGYFSTLLLDLGNVTGNWQISFETDNGGSVDGVSKAPVTVSPLASQVVSLDLYNNTHASTLNNLDVLTLNFSTTDGGTFNINRITAVPEPTTMALLTPLMLGGVFYRRRKAKEADQSKI